MIYGLTIVPSNGCWLINWLNGKDGVKTNSKSFTKLFNNKNDRLNYATAQMMDLFASFYFENGMDKNEKTVNDFRLNLRKGNNICIQGESEHYTFEFFEQEVPWEGINDALADEHTAEAEAGEIPVTNKLPEKSGDVSIMTLSSLYEALKESNHEDPSSGYYTSTFFIYAVNNTAGTNDSALSNVATLEAVGTKWYKQLNKPTTQKTHWTVGDLKLFGGPLDCIYRYGKCDNDVYGFNWYRPDSRNNYSHLNYHWDRFVSGSVYVAVVHS